MNAHAREHDMTRTPSELTSRDLRDAFGCFATGVTVVTCASDHGPVAITANSFSSISLDPALVMWAAGNQSRRFPAFANADYFAIHVLAAEQKGLCDTFSSNGFALSELEHLQNAHGVPLLSDCLARFECRKTQVVPAGDHSIILGEVQRVQHRNGDALTFFGGKFSHLPQA